jgi:hypothetical protein
MLPRTSEGDADVDASDAAAGDATSAAPDTSTKPLMMACLSYKPPSDAGPAPCLTK